MNQHDKEYQRFRDSVAHKCRCVGTVCAGVLQGGLCDGFDEEWHERHDREDDIEDDDAWFTSWWDDQRD